MDFSFSFVLSGGIESINGIPKGAIVDESGIPYTIDGYYIVLEILT